MVWAQNIKRALLTKGGVHPKPNKNSASSRVVPGPDPEVVIIPLLQHVGAPCEPLVELNDRVLVGQKIGDSEEYVCAPVHASVSGEVTGIKEHPHPIGHDVLAVHILSDGRNQLSPDVKPPGDPMDMAAKEIRRIIREGGIVGLGGGVFPTHVKLSPPGEKPIHTVIINGAECEPYLCGDHRLMLERGEEILKGAMIIKRAVGAEKVIVAIEDDKMDAVRRMREIAPGFDVKVEVLRHIYPQGAERTLIDTLMGKEISFGSLPMDVGVVVDNVGTAAAIHDLFRTGMPLVERVVTVDGDGVSGRANLRVRIGTLFKDVIDFLGGTIGEPGKVIMGGPMMGLAQYTTGVPVVKGTTGILVLKGETVFRNESAHFVCIRCGRCVRRCPMKLLPYLIGSYADAGMWSHLDDLVIENCVECGCCAYACPTKSPLVQLIKVGKEGLARQKKKMEALEKATGE